MFVDVKLQSKPTKDSRWGISLLPIFISFADSIMTCKMPLDISPPPGKTRLWRALAGNDHN